MTAHELMEGLNEAQKALAEAQVQEVEKGAVTAISYATLGVEYVIGDGALAIIITTANGFFAGDRAELRRGRIGPWAIVWKREDIGVTTGEDYMPADIRTWLLENTRVVEDRMDWPASERIREVVEGVLSADEEAKAKGSWAYAHVDVDAITRTITITTSHRSFDTCFEIRRGRLGDWTLIWKRNVLWVQTGEDFMPAEIREWLVEHTDSVDVEPRAEQYERYHGGGEDYEDDDEDYVDEDGYPDNYPW